MRSRHEARKNQNIIWAGGYIESPSRAGLGVDGRRARIRTAANMATTPPNLLGTDRRMV